VGHFEDFFGPLVQLLIGSPFHLDITLILHDMKRDCIGKLPRGPEKGPLRAGFGSRAVLCPPLIKQIKSNLKPFLQKNQI